MFVYVLTLLICLNGQCHVHQGNPPLVFQTHDRCDLLVKQLASEDENPNDLWGCETQVEL